MQAGISNIQSSPYLSHGVLPPWFWRLRLENFEKYPRRLWWLAEAATERDRKGVGKFTSSWIASRPKNSNRCWIEWRLLFLAYLPSPLYSRRRVGAIVCTVPLASAKGSRPLSPCARVPRVPHAHRSSLTSAPIVSTRCELIVLFKPASSCLVTTTWYKCTFGGRTTFYCFAVLFASRPLLCLDIFVGGVVHHRRLPAGLGVRANAEPQKDKTKMAVQGQWNIEDWTH